LIFFSIREKKFYMDFNSIYKQYKNVLISYIYKIVHDKETSKDILQDSILKFWQNYDKYIYKNDNYLPLLIEICKNTAYDYLRKNQKQKIQNNLLIENLKDEKMNLDDQHILDKLNSIVYNIEDEQLKELYYMLLHTKSKKKDIAKYMKISDRHLRRKLNQLIQTIKTRLEEKNEKIKP
jgi:RNA polymerase sigma factor (sigma-70 family)